MITSLKRHINDRKTHGEEIANLKDSSWVAK
jgi:hypothetical protein